MVERNLGLYDITVGETPDYHIPYVSFRAMPTGIAIFKVGETGVTPAMDIGIAGRDGGQIGAGAVRATIDTFRDAAAYRTRYDEDVGQGVSS